MLSILWFIFVMVWLISAFSAKRTLRGGWMSRWWRIGILIVVVALIHYHVLQGNGNYPSGRIPVLPVNIAGLILAALGIALAIWARLHLGRNWGMPMAVKEHPELVTSGPYRWLRNPIYTGILLALLGSSFMDWWWAVVFACAAAYFIFAARAEEKLMLAQFPDTYPAYKARTWALIPGIW